MSVELSGRCQHLTLFLAINSTTSMHNYTISTMESRWLRTVFDILTMQTHIVALLFKPTLHQAPRDWIRSCARFVGLSSFSQSSSSQLGLEALVGFGGSGAKIVLPADIAALRNSNFCPCDLPCDLDEVGTVAACDSSHKPLLSLVPIQCRDNASIDFFPLPVPQRHRPR